MGSGTGLVLHPVLLECLVFFVADSPTPAGGFRSEASRAGREDAASQERGGFLPWPGAAGFSCGRRLCQVYAGGTISWHLIAGFMCRSQRCSGFLLRPSARWAKCGQRRRPLETNIDISSNRLFLRERWPRKRAAGRGVQGKLTPMPARLPVDVGGVQRSGLPSGLAVRSRLPHHGLGMS